MTSLSDRLKSLGVQLGAGNLQPAAPRAEYPIYSVVGGTTQLTDFGEAYFVERFIPSEETHGLNPLRFPSILDKLALWAADTRVALLPPERFIFLDTESTGIWGSGTLAFLIGLGRFEPGGFRQVQYFLREPIEERAILEALNRQVSPDDALVTFNGKSFDLPLLGGRYLTNGAKHPFGGLPHLDLLHLARRLWKDLLPSRALGDLEVQLLGVTRSQEDIPGWMIPQMYIDYLHTGDARPLAGVFYHNSMDVLSMASLLYYLAARLAFPLDAEAPHHAELYAIGRLNVDLGFAEDAIDIFQNTLSMDLPKDAHGRLVEHLGLLFRRRGDYEAALQLWEQAAAEGRVYAHVEIAKYYEHRARDYAVALRYTRTAIEVIAAASTPAYERVYWQPLLEHRLARLERRLAGRTT
ncbi:MAG TPA: ribonuclease H-like domain-containing protein [Anaerolineales bacterium]|jgi:hypothetical protein|nr:ribonuclease H-like domain-containing protein [Anaerolineales bacterium]